MAAARSDRRYAALQKIELRTDAQAGELFDNAALRIPSLFFGRDYVVSRIAQFLTARSQNLAINGERGIGKTSAANILAETADGNIELLDIYGERSRIEDDARWLDYLRNKGKRPVYKVVLIKAGLGEPIDELCARLAAIIRSAADARELSKLELALGGQFSGYGANFRVNWEGNKHETISTVRAEIDRYNREAREDLLLIIDEFDTVEQGEKLADALHDSNRVRFVLVGITSFLERLYGKHASVARTLSRLEIRPMHHNELSAMIDGYQYICSRFISLLPDARAQMIRWADGSPYLLKSMLRACFDDALGSSSVREFDHAPVPFDEARLRRVMTPYVGGQAFGDQSFGALMTVYARLIERPDAAKMILGALAAGDGNRVRVKLVREVLADRVDSRELHEYVQWLADAEHWGGVFHVDLSFASDPVLEWLDPVLRRVVKFAAEL